MLGSRWYGPFNLGRVREGFPEEVTLKLRLEVERTGGDKQKVPHIRGKALRVQEAERR